MELKDAPDQGLSTSNKIILFGAMGAVVVAVAGYVVTKALFGVKPLPGPCCKILLDPVRMVGDYSAFMAGPSGQPGDGADDVVKLIERFRTTAEQVEKERMNSSGERPLVEQIDSFDDLHPTVDAGTAAPFKAADDLIAAMDKKDFDCSKLRDIKAIDWRDDDDPKAVPNVKVGEAALIEARIAAARDVDRAIAICRAVVLLGIRMTESQERVMIRVDGCSMQRFGAELMSELFKQKGEAEKAAAAHKYAVTSLGNQAAVSKAVGVCHVIRGFHIGDIVAIARTHPDRAYRIEALLAMGLVQYSKAGAGYDKSIRKFLDEYAKDNDPWIAAAAVWARDLKIEDYRQMGRMQ